MISIRTEVANVKSKHTLLDLVLQLEGHTRPGGTITSSMAVSGPVSSPVGDSISLD